MSDGLSLQQKVQKARERRTSGVEVRVPIDGYEDFLTGVYQTVDWRVKGEIELRYQDEPELDRIWQQQADFLLATSKTVEGTADGKTDDLGPLGAALAAKLGLDVEGDTDKQAVMQFFVDGAALIRHSNVVLEKLSKAERPAVEKTMGESEAAS